MNQSVKKDKSDISARISVKITESTPCERIENVDLSTSLSQPALLRRRQGEESRMGLKGPIRDPSGLDIDSREEPTIIKPDPNRPKVTVLLTNKSKLIYDVPLQLGGGKQDLLLVDDFSTILPEGFTVQIGDNRYEYQVFSEPKKSIEAYKCRNEYPIETELPVGTKVYMGKYIGIPTALALPLKIEVPFNSQIKLAANTCVQHVSSLIALKLVNETEARIISN